MCSNVPGFDSAHCIIEREPDELVSKLASYLGDIREASFELAKNKWSYVFDKLHEQLELWSPEEESSEDEHSGTGEVVESNFCEPPSKRFLHAISKPNSYSEFQKRLQSGEFRVEYNDWSDSKDSSDERLAESDSDSDQTPPSSNQTDNTHHVNLNIPSSIADVNNTVKRMMHNQLKKILSVFNPIAKFFLSSLLMEKIMTLFYPENIYQNILS